ncbi:MAG: efflux RND transporter periplasmic adaptor subunit [Geobacteraceae bacterium]|nr:efflux RND transporter periplasmic adaptor subunit [Geobacteraceae bacterium]
MKKPALAAIAALALVLATILYFASHRDGNDQDVIRVSGNIEATSVEVSFKVPGRVLKRPVDEGETVQVGQIVALLDSADLAHETAIRRAEAEAARAALRELEAGSRDEEIGQSEAALAAAEAEAVRLEDDFRRSEALFAREVIPKQRFDAARAGRDASQAQLRQARESLALVRKGPRRERIDQGRARLREAEAALALASERLGYATLTAPVAGTVLSKNVEPGEQVATGTPVITIGELDSVWMRAFIPETDLGRIKLGQQARVTTDTWPGRVYDGTVTFISSEAEFTPKNVQTSKERVKLVYRIKITLPNPHRELKPGMPADAEILTGKTN